MAAQRRNGHGMATDIRTGRKGQGGGPSSGSPGDELAELHRMRLLVVDDVPTNLALLRAQLASGGFTNVTAAAGGHDALDVLERSIGPDERSSVDAVVLDIKMPDLDGYAVCRRMREEPALADIPVVMVTGYDRWQEETIHAAYEAGATDILFKPFRTAELINRVVTALKLKRERDLRRQRERELEAELAERRVMEARLQYLVGHDDLTGLANRRRLEQILEVASLNAQASGQPLSLLYLDLDRFKLINDREGHGAGDRSLILVANTLRKHAGPGTHLARISADEFALLLEGADRERARRLAETIRAELESLRYESRGRRYTLSASIGVATMEGGVAGRGAELLAQADQACYSAKREGRNRVHVYAETDGALADMEHDSRWGERLRRALEAGGLVLAFQPVVRLRDHAVTHYEVLVRLREDDGSLVLPGEFLPAAERLGLMPELDREVVRRTLELIARLPERLGTLGFNVNLSGHTLHDSAFVDFVREALSRSGVPGRRITFELTETAAIADPERAGEALGQLRALGCRVALDDFGSGFSTYTYLKRFPVDYLKIDGGFIQQLAWDSVDQALVRSIVEIARALEKETVAEFVGDEETLELVRRYGIHYAQGYHLGRPVLELPGAGDPPGA